MKKEFSFEKLDVFKMARFLATRIYQITDDFPSHERFGLTDQLRRASVSVASNIAEGSGKCSGKEKAHYTGISFSSLMEVLCQLQIALDLGYIDKENYEQTRSLIEKLSAYLSNFRRSQLNH